MSKRLAITISRVVSLGSYEASVLYEVIYAIGQHNRDSKTTEDEKIVIDVLTGASAGGMTVTIVAQKLAFEASRSTGHIRMRCTALGSRISALMDCLPRQPGESPAHSCLSLNLVRSSAANMSPGDTGCTCTLFLFPKR